MSLNGYSWVEGNVVNAVDPSGSVSSCFQSEVCEELRRNGASIRTLIRVGCIELESVEASVQPEPTSTPVSIEQAILNATVMIRVVNQDIANSDSSACQKGSVKGSLSTGTITADGVVTHDHFAGRSDFILSYAILSTAACIEIRHQDGTYIETITGESLSQPLLLKGEAFVKGSLLLPREVFSNLPDSQISVYRTPTKEELSMTQYAQVGGTGNIRDCFLSGCNFKLVDAEPYPDDNNLCTDERVPASYGALVATELQEGNSGAGLFLKNGDLVGTTFWGGSSFAFFALLGDSVCREIN